MIIRSTAIYHVEFLFQSSCSIAYHHHHIFNLFLKTKPNSCKMCTNMYQYVPICSDMLQYVLICAGYAQMQSNVWNTHFFSFTKVKAKNPSQDVNDSMVYLD